MGSLLIPYPLSFESSSITPTYLMGSVTYREHKRGRSPIDVGMRLLLLVLPALAACASALSVGSNGGLDLSDVDWSEMSFGSTGSTGGSYGGLSLGGLGGGGSSSSYKTTSSSKSSMGGAGILGPTYMTHRYIQSFWLCIWSSFSWQCF